MNGVGWSFSDTKYLIRQWSLGESPSSIGRKLEKSRNAVISKAKRLGLRKTVTVVVAKQNKRLGQAAFRKGVLKAAAHKCCVSGTDLPEVMEAAHVVPFSKSNDNKIENGLCLRSDLHALFDAGLMKISPSLRVEIDQNVTDPEYRSLDGQQILAPSNVNLFELSSNLAQREEYQNQISNKVAD